MKKIILVLVVSFGMVSCGESSEQKNKVKTSELHPTETISKYDEVGVEMTIYKVDGIEYRIFGMYNGGMGVVNHTKELLEVKLLKEQLNK